MDRFYIKGFLSVALCVFVISISANAHSWQDGYYDSNNDGLTHTHYYYCDDCGEEYSSTESCSWKNTGYYNYKEYGKNGHYYEYECPYCYGTKEVLENCSWKIKERDYFDWNSKKHQVKTYYECSKCGNSKTVVSYNNHVYKWVRYNNSFWYECKYCGKAPKFNGSILMDSNDTDNITLRKNKTYKYTLEGYNKTRNKVKSISISKKKICSVKKKGRTLSIKGKKKGKCKVTVKMRSGAKYRLNIRIK